MTVRTTANRATSVQAPARASVEDVEGMEDMENSAPGAAAESTERAECAERTESTGSTASPVLWVEPTHRLGSGSHLVASMAAAEALAVVDEDVPEVGVGDEVGLIALSAPAAPGSGRPPRVRGPEPTLTGTCRSTA